MDIYIQIQHTIVQIGAYFLKKQNLFLQNLCWQKLLVPTVALFVFFLSFLFPFNFIAILEVC
jgi:hypothetical protein